MHLAILHPFEHIEFVSSMGHWDHLSQHSRRENQGVFETRKANNLAEG